MSRRTLYLHLVMRPGSCTQKEQGTKKKVCSKGTKGIQPPPPPPHSLQLFGFYGNLYPPFRCNVFTTTSGYAGAFA